MHSPGSGLVARLGAVAFIHRFESTLNPHIHFHCVVIDGVFTSAPASGVIFHAATGSTSKFAGVQECVRPRLLRVFVGAACCRPMPRGRWCKGSTGADFPWTPRCASRPLTALGASVCCATAPWTGYANSIPNACSMRASSPVRAAARCSSPPSSGSPPRCRRRASTATAYFGVLARTAAHGKFPRRPRTAGVGRYGKLSITAIMERCFLWKAPQCERAPLLGKLAAAAPSSFA